MMKAMSAMSAFGRVPTSGLRLRRAPHPLHGPRRADLLDQLGLLLESPVPLRLVGPPPRLGRLTGLLPHADGSLSSRASSHDRLLAPGELLDQPRQTG